MRLHMAHLNFIEHIPFSSVSFWDFTVDGRRYTPAKGTVRTYLGEFKANLEIKYYDGTSNPVYYELIESNLPKKLMTHNHTGVSNISHNDPVYRMLMNIPWDKQAIHDIHLKFKAPNVYENFSKKPYPKYKKNEQIALESFAMNNAITRTTISKNDTVTVIIGCSLQPIPLDYNIITRFSSILARAEGHLEGLTAKNNDYKIDETQRIPSFEKWMITEWHFGRDALKRYKGKPFEITVEDANHRLYIVYVKDFGKLAKLRIEGVGTPRKTVEHAIQKILNSGLNFDLDLNDTTPINSQLLDIGTN